MNQLTPFLSAGLGGIYIGLAVVWLMWSNGRIAGVSGILGGLMRFDKGEFTWRAAFLIGLIASPWLYSRVSGEDIFIYDGTPMGLAVAAGLLVGVGTQIGNGCTSGHGVCGTSRLSIRSIIATATFMLTGAITVYILRHGFGA